MKYLLDTDICIHIIRKRPQEVFEKFRQLEIGDVAISSVTFSELSFGVCKSRDPERNNEALMEFVSPLEIAPYDDSVGPVYGRVRAQLESIGLPIGPMDTMIAAHALSLSLKLVTNNEREFTRVEGLDVENWLA